MLPAIVTPDQIREQFLLFSQPIAVYATLGARKQAVESLAKNLWVAMVGGELAEQKLWQALKEQPGIDDSLYASLQACYETEMKPAIAPATLAAVRQHYGIK